MPKFSNTKICSFLNAEIFELPTFYTFERWNSQTQKCSSLWDIECANSRTLKFSNVEIFVCWNSRIFKWLRNIQVAELELYYFRNNRGAVLMTGHKTTLPRRPWINIHDMLFSDCSWRWITAPTCSTCPRNGSEEFVFIKIWKLSSTLSRVPRMVERVRT